MGRFLEMEHSILLYSIQRLPVTLTLYSLFLFSAGLSCISAHSRCLAGVTTCRYNIYILLGLVLSKKSSEPETDPLFSFYDYTVLQSVYSPSDRHLPPWQGPGTNSKIYVCKHNNTSHLDETKTVW